MVEQNKERQKSMSNILLLEDDLSLINGLSFAFRKQGFELNIARTLKEAEELWTDGKYDLLVLDVSLPDGSGFEFCQRVRLTSKVPIIFLTASDEETSIIMGLDIGGDDYITKPYNPMELTARVKSSLRRYMQLGDIGTISKTDEIKIGGLVMDKQAKSLTVDGAEVRLTATEYKILELLMENAGRVFSAEEIYRKVWNEDAYAVENTVMVHIRHIREKIEIDPKEPRYLKVVWGIGYKVEKIK